MLQQLSGPFLILGRGGMDFYADPPGQRIPAAGQFTAALGGSAANCAVALVKLGQSASLLTCLSDDPVGRFVARQLDHYGVDRRLVTFLPGDARTSLAVIETTAEAPGVIYRNHAVDLQLDSAMLAAVDWSAFGTLVVSGTALNAEPSRSACLLALDRARAAGLRRVIDLDYRPYNWPSPAAAGAIYAEACARCDLVIGNDVEMALLGADALNRWQREGRAYVLKMGAEGNRAFTGQGSEQFTPPFPVQALKPTGAGDGFLGGLLASLAEGRDWPSALRRGSAVAAIVVTRVACAPAIPTLSELEAFLDAHPAV